MRFWFDTEFFENGRNINLISIGVVAEDGREYYAETNQAKWLAQRTKWLRENVAPGLSNVPKARNVIAAELVGFFGHEPEIWAYYGSYDWVVLCQLYGKMIDLPNRWPMFPMDVKQFCVMKGNPKLPDQYTQKHNALADAWWTRRAWEFLAKEK